MTLFLVWRLFCTLLFHRIHFVTKKDNLLQVLLKQIVKVTFDQVLSVNLQKKALEKGAVSGIFFKIDFWQQVIFHLRNSVSFSPPYILSVIRILPLIYLIPIGLLTSLVPLVPPYSPHLPPQNFPPNFLFIHLEPNTVVNNSHLISSVIHNQNLWNAEFSQKQFF